MNHIILDIDGNDGTGKSTVIKLLQQKCNPNEITFNDRGILTKLTDVYDEDLPESLPNDRCYLILDADPDILMRRIYKRGPPFDKYDTYPKIFQYKNRFMRLAIKYQTLYIDTSKLSIANVMRHITDILNNIRIDIAHNMISNYIIAHNMISNQEPYYNQVFTLPNPDLIDEKQFNELKLVAEGHSKIIRAYNEQFTLIEYKPTVYSHKQQREGIIPYTDKERMEMTKDILFIFDMEQIPHAYVYIGKKYILCRRLNPERDIPPVEVIVKKCCVGTDKYRYHGIDRLIGRNGTPIVDFDKREYPEYLVRYDYRNPNHVYIKKEENGTETALFLPHYLDKETEDNLLSNPTIYKKPKGDEAMCDDLANQFIDVSASKQLAKKTFDVLNKHFLKMGIYFEDVCFMITNDGKMHYSEVSQDCGRYKKIEENGLTDLDKDVWRAGGSSNLVYEKWRQMTQITKDYVKSIY